MAEDHHMRFTKMHGYGNCYIYVDCRNEQIENAPELARRISDRNTGVGSDGLFLIYPSDVADARAEMYNADGSRMPMCGNGVRCSAKFVLDDDWNAGRVIHKSQPMESLLSSLKQDEGDNLNRVLARTIAAMNKPADTMLSVVGVDIETDTGIRNMYAYSSNEPLTQLTTDIGPPSLLLSEMACTLPGETAVDRPVTVGDRQYNLTCVQTGNLHGVVFVNDIMGVDLHVEGPALERASFFPERANIHFVQVIDSSHLKMCIWERGSGPTRACGTGACAAVVAAKATGRSGSFCEVEQPGGRQLVDVADTIYLTGEAHTICRGKWL